MRTTFHVAGWLAGLAGLLLVLSGCALAPSASSQTRGIHIQGSASRLSLNTPERMCRAILVMDADVSGLGASHWNTPDGTRPAAADELTLLKGGYAIYTPIHFSSMHIHLDYRRQPTKEFDTIGGQVGADTDSEGYPQVTPQQSYLLALVYGIEAQKGEVKTVMIVTDAFPIDAQGIVTLKPAHTEEGQNNQTENFPAVTMPLSQIVQQLANCPAA